MAATCRRSPRAPAASSSAPTGAAWLAPTPPTLIALGNLDKVFAFGEGIVQGMIDVEALAALARTKIAAQLLVDGAGASVADTAADLTFFGISQGHILGSTL